MYSFTTGFENTLVKYDIDEVGDDLHISITGGVVHIGGVALVSDGGYNLLSVKNHKEYELIRPLAETLTKYEDITIMISAGIHVEDISLDEIKTILENNNEAIEQIDKYISDEYNIFHEFR